MKRHAIARGFTLVELMIAMLITGVVTVVIFALFDSTSDNFLEVDNLADVDDRLRFSMQRIRSDFQAAASQSSPDSLSDPWVEPKDPGVHVAGFMGYTDWFDQDPANAEIASVNPLAQNDGIVVMGAFDYPLPFEVTGLSRNAADNGSGGRIQAHYRGLMRLSTADPFQDGLDSETLITTWGQVEFLQTNWETRLLRIRDRQGFSQFSAFDGGIDAGDFITPDGDWAYLGFALNAANDTLGPKYKIANADDVAGGFSSSDVGLDEVPEADVGYDAALIDAFWYHVIQDPTNERNQQLVRDRLCAREVAENFGDDPAGLLASTCGGTDERVVVANNVADFRVWFDCADATGPSAGVVNGAAWGANWQPPNRGASCLDASPPRPGLARVAHVRLSIHTPTERKDQAHIQFEDADGALCPPDPITGAADTGCNAATVGTARMRTFDIYPKTVGAARVATLQSDFELTNFTARDIR